MVDKTSSAFLLGLRHGKKLSAPRAYIRANGEIIFCLEEDKNKGRFWAEEYQAGYDQGLASISSN